MVATHEISGRALHEASKALYGEVEGPEDSISGLCNTADDSDSEFTKESDLSNLSHRVWIVTTAALPWMTGTAVNPLLRALALTRGRDEGFVTLLIPWLSYKKARTKLYGKEKTFRNSDEQEEYIRNFCRTKAKSAKEEKKLKIRFYSAVYHEAFGSIFPTCDICMLIPDDEADIAILEEPEHLNWFRVPDEKEKPDDDKEEDNSVVPLSQSQNDRDEANAYQLGWTNKFNHVVGILHTNYEAYMQDYGLGASIIGAPAIKILSSIVVRAYCHRVIRLSAVLPSLAPNKEVTSNVHGVRAEFLDSCCISDGAGSEEEEQASVYFIGKLIWAKGFDKVLRLQKLYKDSTKSYFHIDIFGGGSDDRAIKRAFYGRKRTGPYDDTLKKVETTDIKESANRSQEDSEAEQLFKQENSIRQQLSIASEQAVEEQSPKIMASACGSREDNSPYPLIKSEQQAVDLKQTSSGENPCSLVDSVSNMSISTGRAATNAVRRLSNTVRKAGFDRLIQDKGPGSTSDCSPFSIIGDLPGISVSTGFAATQAVHKLGDRIIKAGLEMTFTEIEPNDDDDEVSEDDQQDDDGSSVNDSKEEINEKDCDIGNDGEIDLKKKKRQVVFDPPQTIFELRRTPIPAKFLGVKDHALLRNLPKYKIFLNMSTTEVLCTTTAEALAMGKFVIIPDHTSNTFFLQFPNCLAYKSMKECVAKLKWAMINEPTPLTEELWHKFTWEGASERLIKASGISRRELRERIDSGQEKADREVAWLHIETTKKGQLVRSFLPQQK
mmetsp:Transcript_23533/g.35598  ORF Transcript_23533/g.35598 Transcript_23533/m.35598 type:complete len:778 (-) Transcript_23533:792-3125(-)